MVKNKGGRPTKYNKQKLEDTEKYYNEYYLAEPFIKQRVLDRTGSIKEVDSPNPKYFEPPYLEELALRFEVDEDTITNWAKKNKKFFGAIKKIKTLQKVRLLQSTLNKNSATGSIFQLKVNHNMIEVNRTEHTGKDGDDLFKNLTDEQLDARINAKKEQTGIA